MRLPKATPAVLRISGAVIGLLLVAALLGLISGPGRGMRGDIARQKQLITAQLDVTRDQLAITQEQLGITKEQLQLARDQLAIAREQLKRTDESLSLQRQLLAIAQATLEQVKELNRKTPNASPASNVTAPTGR